MRNFIIKLAVSIPLIIGILAIKSNTRKKMNKDNLTILTDKNFQNFKELATEYCNKFHILQEWLDEKKRTLPCYTSYAFDNDGNLYIKEFLGNRNLWLYVAPENVVQQEVYTSSIRRK